MLDIIQRIINVVKHEIKSKKTNDFKDDFNQANHDYQEEDQFKFKREYSQNSKTNHKFPFLQEDLELFELQTPFTLDQLKKKRNKIIKKYHPDRFAKNSSKQQIAKEMIQIYNSAYERILKRHEKKKI